MTKLHKMRRSPKWHAGHWGALNRWVWWERWGRHECQKENSTQKHDHNFATSHMWKLFLVFCFCSVLISLEDVLALWHCERIIDSFSNVSSGYMKPQQGTGLSWLGPIANPKDSFSDTTKTNMKRGLKWFPPTTYDWHRVTDLVHLGTDLIPFEGDGVEGGAGALPTPGTDASSASVLRSCPSMHLGKVESFFCWNTFATLLFVFVFWVLEGGCGRSEPLVSFHSSSIYVNLKNA